MIAIVILHQFPWKDDLRCSDATKILELASGLAHHCRYFFRSFTAAVTIQQDINLDSRLAPFSKAQRKFTSERAAFKEILSEGDTRFGVFYLPQHRWKSRIAVVEHGDFITADDGSVGERFKRWEKGCISRCYLGHIANRTHLRATHWFDGSATWWRIGFFACWIPSSRRRAVFWKRLH